MGMGRGTRRRRIAPAIGLVLAVIVGLPACGVQVGTAPVHPAPGPSTPDAGAALPPHLGRLGYHPADHCPMPVPDGARNLEVTCGWLTVLEDHADPHSRRIHLAVARIHSRSAHPAADPVVEIEGGPGYSSLHQIESYETLSSLAVTTVRSVRQLVASLSGGQRQSVAIAKAVLWNSKLVIMDEPTAALGVAQTTQVLDLVRRLADRGLAVLIVSHNMNDVFQIPDRIAVLYLGKLAAVRPASEMDRQIVVDLMTTGASSRTAASNGGGQP